MKGEDISPIGDTFESFLESVDSREEVYSAAIKRVISWELEEARKATDLTKTAMAEAMQTSRSQVERVLHPENVAVSLDVLSRAALAVGKRLKVELVDAP
ncbi:XRE family transcriptional regulator [Skermanella rosea]|uniref:XRE family transcriptional regulator n=1 Tax=Skermanella rosea TaxID=1817965 RepID=UPI001932DBA0|nr:XRE family transcriptional regulator [Skermanella rosea]UEM04550.1 XRE family transcriptional regulator [Skermanella rosea]